MNLPDINPALFTLPPFHLAGATIGPISVRWYALAYVTGIVAGWFYAARLLRRTDLWMPRTPPLEPEHLDDLVLWLTLGVIVGGRIGYVLFYDTSLIWERPLGIFQVWEGGMSFHGGFTGVMIASLIYCRVKGFDLARTLNLGDLLASCAPIGLFFGRLANFVNGELWGRVTHVPWGMVFCNHYTPSDIYGRCLAGPEPRHPSQLYEAFGEGIILFTLLWWLGNRRGQFRRPGLIMGVFIAGYGIIRILLENVRNPDAQMPEFLRHWITMGMILSLPMVAAGAFLIWNGRRMEVLPAPIQDGKPGTAA
ncbi:MAG: prolipoprotein diacylglyceryl transferase [Asticcacaulis sp.]